jgi:hypothetical protein
VRSSGRAHRHHHKADCSNAKMRFQSSFLPITLQLFFIASSPLV